MALKHLKETYQNRYNFLQATGDLMKVMHQVNEEAYNQLELIMEQMLQKNPIKNPQNTMESYKHREQVKAAAEETVLNEIVFKKR